MNPIKRLLIFWKLGSYFCETDFVIINFSTELLESNTKKLNEKLNEGWLVSNQFQFEFSIVYELWRYAKKK